MQTYYDHEGNEISRQQIEDAIASGTARIICGRGDGRTNTALALTVDQDWDTRELCASVWDESWTVQPKDLRQALDAARAEG